MRHYLPDIRHQKTRRPGGRIFGCASLLVHLAACWSNATILNPLQPFGTLKSNYHRPLAEVQFEIAPSWTAIARRNYYEYLEKNAFFGPTIRADSTPTPRQFPFVMRFELEIGVGIYESSFSTRNKPACAGWIFESGAIVRSGSNQTPSSASLSATLHEDPRQRRHAGKHKTCPPRHPTSATQTSASPSPIGRNSRPAWLDCCSSNCKLGRRRRARQNIGTSYYDKSTPRPLSIITRRH